MIIVKDLYKRYHNHHGSDWVLNNINLEIPTGVSVGLIGRNGAGKSTLLRLIAGMDSPERGSIERRCKVSWPIGLSGGFQGSMTGRQNVKFVARAHGDRHDVDKIIKKVEDFAEIGSAFDEPITTYSSGMRARLNFGLSLAFDFDVYLSDEATAVGDRAFKAKATKAFQDKIGKASLIMVSHGEGTLKQLCQAGIYLKDGQAFWHDDINDAIQAYHIDTDTPKSNDVSNDQSNRDMSFSEAQERLRVCKSIFDNAKYQLDAAKTEVISEHGVEEYEYEFRRARKRLHEMRRKVQSLQESN